MLFKKGKYCSSADQGHGTHVVFSVFHLFTLSTDFSGSLVRAVGGFLFFFLSFSFFFFLLFFPNFQNTSFCLSFSFQSFLFSMIHAFSDFQAELVRVVLEIRFCYERTTKNHAYANFPKPREEMEDLSLPAMNRAFVSSGFCSFLVAPELRRDI